MRRLAPRGTYALLIHLGHDTTIAIGRLGSFHFPVGYYVYVGSALGSGGLEARLARHRRQCKTLHWHIDYLLAQARIVDVKVSETEERLECSWARALLERPEARVIAPGMGSSDCTCPSHLVYLGSEDRLRWDWQSIGPGTQADPRSDRP
jgi:Uri superfamily endonuclease